MATIIEPDGTKREVKPEDGVSFTAQELHAIVGGFFEMVTLVNITATEREVLFVNEDGLRENLPSNPLATRLYIAAGGIPAPQGVVGTVLKCRIRIETDYAPERVW